MKMRCLFLVFIISAASAAAVAQAKTVTDLDLAKYKQERVAAEKDLRENYAKLGFSSPDEMAKRNAKSAEEMQELSARLRGERLIREAASAQIEQQRAAQARYNAYIQSLNSYGQPVQNGYLDYWNYGYGFGYPVTYPQRRGTAWRADGSGVVYEPGGRPSSIWTPRVPAPRPIFRIHR